MSDPLPILERCARAIGEELDYGYMPLIFAETVHRGDCTNENFTCAVCIQEDLTAAAKAVLREIMEPSEGMRDAGFEAALQGYSSAPDDLPLSVVQRRLCVWAWKAAIDHILGGGR